MVGGGHGGDATVGRRGSKVNTSGPVAGLEKMVSTMCHGQAYVPGLHVHGGVEVDDGVRERVEDAEPGLAAPIDSGGRGGRPQSRSRPSAQGREGCLARLRVWTLRKRRETPGILAAWVVGGVTGQMPWKETSMWSGLVGSIFLSLVRC
jgi:hypothetical protein